MKLKVVFAVFAVLLPAAVSTPGSSNQYGCGSNKCQNAVRNGPSYGQSPKYKASSDCDSFLATKVTPCPVTHYQTLTYTSTVRATTTHVVDYKYCHVDIYRHRGKTVTRTKVVTETDPASTTVPATATSTSTTTSTIVTTTTTTVTLSRTKLVVVTPSIVPRKRGEYGCPLTSTATKVPAYASACDGAAYSSACSCIGAKARKTTLPASTTNKVTFTARTYTPTITERTRSTLYITHTIYDAYGKCKTVYSTSTSTTTTFKTTTITSTTTIAEIATAFTTSYDSTATQTFTTTAATATVTGCPLRSSEGYRDGYYVSYMEAPYKVLGLQSLKTAGVRFYLDLDGYLRDVQGVKVVVSSQGGSYVYAADGASMPDPDFSPLKCTVRTDGTLYCGAEQGTFKSEFYDNQNTPKFFYAVDGDNRILMYLQFDCTL